MTQTSDKKAVAAQQPHAQTARAERAFSVSMLISAVRCTLSYVVIPFLAPLAGFARGVGPALGISIATVGIAANVYSMRRFWRADHRWRRPVTVLHVVMIGVLLVLIAVDVRSLLG